jgi:hypothetical protein
MLITLIVLAALNLALSVVVFCSLRALWARLPEPVANNITVGDVASVKDVADAWLAQQQDLRAKPPALTPEELAQVTAYRAKWKGVITDDQGDAEVLALMRINPS